MILAINANAAVDIVMFIDRFLPGDTMRPTRVVRSVGGKSLVSAVILRALGAPVKAVSFAAGRNGETLASLLQDHQIDIDLIWVEGETRVANVIVETDFNRHSHITTPGYTVTEQDCDTFINRIRLNAANARWAVIAGSLPGGAPPSLYAEIIRVLHQEGVKVLIDCFGPPAVEALEASPEIVKMNQDEFTMTFQLEPQTEGDWVAAVRDVMQRCAIQNFVLTCGKAGILACTSQTTYFSKAPLMKEVNAAGSGDAVSATIAYRLSLGETWDQALAWAASAGAAVVLTEGTADCRMEDVLRIYPQTSVDVIEEKKRGR